MALLFYFSRAFIQKTNWLFFFDVKLSGELLNFTFNNH